MDSKTLFACAHAFNDLIGTRYIIHLGRAGKIAQLTITFESEDCHHLMGLHYLRDRADRRNRAKILNDLLEDPDYRDHIASSKHWTDTLESRVVCTTILEQILDDNRTIYRYNNKQLQFTSSITAEYLLANANYPLRTGSCNDIYLFLGKRSDESSNYFCRSIFPKSNLDFTMHQAKWALLYKEKLDACNNSSILYCHNGYSPNA